MEVIWKIIIVNLDFIRLCRLDIWVYSILIGIVIGGVVKYCV